MTLRIKKQKKSSSKRILTLKLITKTMFMRKRKRKIVNDEISKEAKKDQN